LLGVINPAYNRGQIASLALSDFLDKRAASNDAVVAAQLDRTDLIMSGVVVFGVLFALAIGSSLIHNITQPLGTAVAFARRVAGGDLSSRIEVTSDNEIGKLLEALSDMENSLAEIVGNVHAGTSMISTASSQITAGNQDLSARTEDQASSLEETAAEMDQLNGTVKNNAENARQANQLVASASGIAVKGGDVMHQVVAMMANINESSRKIVDIIGVIDGIAFQTNILALNAAVEAARAGE
jgi:methyl-accepting chemotaxis protein